MYMMSNKSKTLYVGFTNDLVRRVLEHKKKLVEGFTARYNMGRLVYYEMYDNTEQALHREKQIKGWLRSKKVALVNSFNPGWEDIASDWEKVQPSVKSLHQQNTIRGRGMSIARTLLASRPNTRTLT